MRRDDVPGGMGPVTELFLGCDCGFRVVSADLHELVEQARHHARTAHGMELSSEQVTALARPLTEEKEQR